MNGISMRLLILKTKPTNLRSSAVFWIPTSKDFTATERKTIYSYNPNKRLTQVEKFKELIK